MLNYNLSLYFLEFNIKHHLFKKILRPATQFLSHLFELKYFK